MDEYTRNRIAEYVDDASFYQWFENYAPTSLCTKNNTKECFINHLEKAIALIERMAAYTERIIGINFKARENRIIVHGGNIATSLKVNIEGTSVFHLYSCIYLVYCKSGNRYSVLSDVISQILDVMTKLNLDATEALSKLMGHKTDNTFHSLPTKTDPRAESIKQMIDELVAEKAEIKDKLNKAIESCDSLNKNYTNTRNEKIVLEKKCDRLEAELEELTNHHEGQIAALKTQIDAFKKQAANSSLKPEETTKLEKIIVEKDKLIHELRNQLTTLSTQTKKLEKENRELATKQKNADGSNGVSNNLINYESVIEYIADCDNDANVDSLKSMLKALLPKEKHRKISTDIKAKQKELKGGEQSQAQTIVQVQAGGINVQQADKVGK